MKVQVAIYARCSCGFDVSEQHQVQALRDLADDRGWTVARLFIDRSSARRGPDRRPGEASLRAAIKNGEIQMVLIWSVCRIGRSLADLVSLLEACRAAEVGLIFREERIDTSRDDRLTLFDLSPILAAHVHAMRREKIICGQIAARKLSVPFGRPPLSQAKLDAARRELNGGKSVRQVARLVGISPTSVARLKNAIASAAIEGTLPPTN